MLNDELASEEKLLGEARDAYGNGAPQPLPDEQTDAEKYRQRIAKLRQAVQLHERNVEALRKEIAAIALSCGALRDAGARSAAVRATMKLRLFSRRRRSPMPARELDLLATAVLLLDGRGRVVYANPAAENLFELSRQKLVRPCARRTVRRLRARCAPRSTSATAHRRVVHRAGARARRSRASRSCT